MPNRIPVMATAKVSGRPRRASWFTTQPHGAITASGNASTKSKLKNTPIAIADGRAPGESTRQRTHGGQHPHQRMPTLQFFPIHAQCKRCPQTRINEPAKYELLEKGRDPDPVDHQQPRRARGEKPIHRHFAGYRQQMSDKLHPDHGHDPAQQHRAYGLEAELAPMDRLPKPNSVLRAEPPPSNPKPQ